MYVANGWKQTKRGGAKNDSPTTAGAGGKVPRVGVNRSDLEAQGIAHGWTVGPLTMEQVRAMSSATLRWHEQFNGENLEKAFASQTVDKHNKIVRVNQASKRMWDGQATEEESQQAFAAGDKFANRYAQFIRSQANAEVMTEYMAQNNLDATQVQSYIEAFEKLVPLGKLALNPSAIGAGSETEIYDVSKHRNYHLLLQAQRRPSEIDRMSADQFKAARPELADTRVPFIVAVRQEREANNTAHVKTTETVTASSGSTKVVDYPPTQHGVPAQPEKVSFRKKINSMTADEIQQECAINPGFRKSLDEME
jgi:hypothetical protein